MKNIIILLTLFISSTTIAQLKIVQKKPLTIAKGNVLDAAAYRKAPIAFVPFTETADARKRGFKSDSLYIWTDPNGGRHRAYGRDILNQVNEVEKDLCARGHSFRQKNTFDGMKATLPPNIGKDGIYKIPPQFEEKKSGATQKIPGKYNIPNTNFGGTIYPYFGELNNSIEFPGIIGDVTNIKYMPDYPTIFTLPLVLAGSPELFKNLKNCRVELFNNVEKKGTPLMYGEVFTNVATKSIPWRNQLVNNSENVPVNTNGMWLYNYAVVFDNSKNILPKPTKEHNYYYINLSFKDNNNKTIYLSVQNNIVLDNALTPALKVSSFKSKKINSFNYRATDPIINAFGLYAKSNGFIANTSSESFGFTGTGINKKSSISADASIGAVYYNFEHLINKDTPISNELELLGFTFSSSNDYYKAENAPPPINVKKGSADIFSNPTTKLECRVLGEPITNNYYEITKEVFNQRFFIGPVPCQATITLKGSAGIKGSGSYTPKTGNMNATVEPYASLNVIGEGGVDAYIAYAKVVVDVNLLTVSFPINFNVENATKADVDAAIKISGLSGKVGFVAGFCIPIPFFDDICKEFSIEIFNWTGPEKTYQIGN